MNDNPKWSYLSTGNVVDYRGKLYIVIDYCFIKDKPDKNRVVLVPLNASNSKVYVTERTAYRERYECEEFGTIAKKCDFCGDSCKSFKVRDENYSLDAIVKVADNVETLVMNNLRKMVFNSTY